MTYSSQWDTAYENGQRRPAHNIRPELLLLLKNFVGEDLKGQRFLELGCGTGNNANWILQNGGEYCGVDGSEPVILEAATHEYLGEPNFACADFTVSQPFGGNFDVVFDRAGLSCNDSESIKRAVVIAYQSLKPGGLYFGIDWFSILHSEFTRGKEIDELTRTDYPDGQFVGTGPAHFTHEGELHELFNWGNPLWIVERVTRYPAVGQFMYYPYPVPWIAPVFNGKGYITGVFDFVVRKPA